MMTTVTNPAGRKATTELVDLKIVEGSVVGDGDNPPAKIAMFKNRTGDEVKPEKEPLISGFFKRAREWAGSVTKAYGEPRTTGQILAMDEFRDKFWKARMALVESMNSILECAPPGDVGPLMAKSVEEFTSVVSAVSAAMGSDKRAEISAIIAQMSGALKDHGSVKRRELVGAVEKLEDFTFTVETNVSLAPGESTKAADETNKEKNMSANTEKKAAKTMDELLANLDPSEKLLLDEHIKSKSTPVDTSKSTTEDPALKEATPAIMKLLEKMSGEIADLRGDKAATEISTKARRIARNVEGLNVEDIEDHLKDAQKNGGKEGLERAERMFLSMSALARKGDALRKSLGNSGVNVNPDKPRTADELVSNKARKMMETEKGLTYESAYTRVMNADPQLAAAAIAGASLDD